MRSLTRLHLGYVSLLGLCLSATAIAAPPNKPQLPVKLHRLFTPFWTIEGGRHSVMQIHNNLINSPLKINPVLLSDLGERIELPGINLAPLQNVSVDIQDELRKLSKTNITSGSAIFEYLLDHGGALSAEISVSESAKSLMYTIISSEIGAKSKRLSSVYWFPRGSGARVFAALQNTTDSTVTVSGMVDGNGKTKPLGTVTLEPLQSTVMWADISASDLSGEQFGSVVLTHDAKEGGLQVSGWLEMGSTGYSNMMIFDDPGVHRGTTLYGTQIFLGPRDDLFASKRETAVDSRVVLSNSSDTPILTDVDLIYETNGNMVHVPIPVGTLEAHQVKSVDLNTARISADSATGSLVVHYNGPEGAVMGRIFGITDRASIGFYSALETYTPGAISEAYWTTEGDSESLLTVTNFDDKPDKITIVVTHAGGGEELPPIELKPFQSTTIKLRELKQRGFLPSAEFGGFRVFGSSYERSKLLIKEHVISESAHMAAPFYGGYPFVVYWWMEFDEHPLQAGDATLIHGRAEWSEGWVSENTGFSHLASGTTSVATVGQGSGFGYEIYGISPGSSRFDGAAFLPGDSTGLLEMLYNFLQLDVVCAEPINFRQTDVIPNNGTLSFIYIWDSSSGKKSNLRSCQIFEHVTYPAGNPYHPSSPPFPSTLSFPNPTTGPSVEFSGSIPFAIDTHSTPGTFVTPFPPGTTSFTASQAYYYRCPCFLGGVDVKLFPESGEITITRSVNATTSTSGMFTIQKSGASSSKSVP